MKNKINGKIRKANYRERELINKNLIDKYDKRLNNKGSKSSFIDSIYEDENLVNNQNGKNILGNIREKDIKLVNEKIKNGIVNNHKLPYSKEALNSIL